MSNAVSAMNAATWSERDMSVRDMGLQGMITIRADLGDAKVKKAIKSATGAAVPDIRRMTTSKQGRVAWMSPDELLVLCTYDTAETIASKLRKSLTESHALVAVVSDARAMFTISGPHAREALAKIAPVDMSSAEMTSGMVRRTRLAQVPAAIWMDGDHVCVVCFRSVAQYVYDLLCTSAHPDAVVGYY